MRPLTKNERRLALLLVLLLVTAGSLVLWNFLLGVRRELLADQDRQRSALLEHKTWLGQKALWTQRIQWLQENQPPGTSPSALLETVQQAAQKHGIEVRDPKLASPNPQPLYLEIAVGLSAIGSMNQLAAWLADLQQPKRFLHFKQLVIKPADDKGNLRADVIVAQWCQPQS